MPWPRIWFMAFPPSWASTNFLNAMDPVHRFVKSFSSISVIFPAQMIEPIPRAEASFFNDLPERGSEW